MICLFLFQFVIFCEKLARVMKLDEIADDVGLDVNGDALLARGEQLVKLEVKLFLETSSMCALSTCVAGTRNRKKISGTIHTHEARVRFLVSRAHPAAQAR